LTSIYESSELGAPEPCHYAFERNQDVPNPVVFLIEVTLMKKQKRSQPIQTPLRLSSFNEAGYAAYIGIDWADRKHDISLYECETQAVEHCVISSQPEAIDAWVEELRQRFSGKSVAIALEQKRGPLIYALCKYEFLVLFPVELLGNRA
jgi:hypothetical protein